MNFLKELFTEKKTEMDVPENDVVVAMCDGELIPAEKIADPVFSGNLLGKTVAIEPTSSDIVSPVSGTLSAVFPTGHAFGVSGADGSGYLIHIGIDTVSMNGTGFKLLKTQGDTVKAGETVVQTDLKEIEKQGHARTVMLIVTEPVEGKSYDYIDYGPVKQGQRISG